MIQTGDQIGNLDAVPKRQKANPFRRCPEENSEGSEGAVGEGEAGTKAEGI